ncbi:glucose-6-phosphate dehydrogenase [Pseudoclavibacter caeni]|uniref:Glucose-6-phosphate 1-dehydrogenase n=1 Tax=Pseudoclavibacter caeni TaxID=908846 RepID=A0A7C8FUI9_9MICO|nr:glucose-6-phosphate dehydrogenase [Pseudoclavibacter caeni]KAB1632869.1 glucose-6-phosphate dehydrogenase [Pseudoclavibacter caeni]NYJ97169.1 glucose-6-phosphate 1-dehydrogenase [Pseudoclavibacter caeni]
MASPALDVTGDAFTPLRRADDRRLLRIAGPAALVIFGVTGDLAQRKLLPAVYDLANRGLLSPAFSLVGFGRREWSADRFAAFVEQAVRRGARTPFRQQVWDQLAAGFRFVSGAFDDPAAYQQLDATLRELTRVRGTRGNAAFYLSIPPRHFSDVCDHLARQGLAGHDDRSWRRVVIEKPFGHDLRSAQALNAVVERVFAPDDIFRIDHYLGKETVQNILAFRFANAIFEPLWNANHIDHVQITMAEDIGIGGRAGYYDGIGAARDVIQNHLLQLLALTAMEEPTSFSPRALRSEKIKVLGALGLPADLEAHTARGQYLGGWQGGRLVHGYLDEEGTAPDSTTETYAAFRVDVHTRRWAGVPFYLRAGKRLGRRVTEIALVFREIPQQLFTPGQTAAMGPNALVIRVQPEEGITLRFGSKVPDTNMTVRDVNMDFVYGHSFAEASPEAYERLILDMLLGDPPLFPRHEEVELGWRVLDPIERLWAEHGRPEGYRPGTWGPASADTMLARDGRRWRRP